MADLRADKKLAQTGVQHVELEVEPPLAAETGMKMGRGGFGDYICIALWFYTYIYIYIYHICI